MNKKKSIEELNRITVEDYKIAEKQPITVVLDNVRSLNNIGSIFRTCDAFCIEKILLCGKSGTPPNPEIHKTALGAEFSVDWTYFNNTLDAIQELKNSGYTIISIEQCQGSLMLNNYNYNNEKIAIIFGNEVSGVDQNVVDISDFCLEIPQFGTKHSLNVAVSAGIVIWHITKTQ